jgi:hypothetical protein
MPKIMIDTDALAEAVETLERYGAVDADIVRVVDVLADLVDDRAHGRDLTSVRRKLVDAVAAIDDWRA